MIEGLPQRSRSIRKTSHVESATTIGKPQFEDCIGIIIKSTRPFLKYIGTYGMTPEDLFQVASIEVICKLPKFDPSAASISTFLFSSIKGAIKRELRDRGRIIRLPRSISEGITQFMNYEEFLTHELGRKPTDNELSEYTGMTLQLITEVKIALEERVSAPDTISPLIDDAFTDRPLNTNDPEEENDGENNLMNKNVLAEALTKLTDEERKVVQLYYGIDYGKTLSQSEIAELMGSYQVNISRILQRARDKIATYLNRIDFNIHS